MGRSKKPPSNPAKDRRDKGERDDVAIAEERLARAFAKPPPVTDPTDPRAHPQSVSNAPEDAWHLVDPEKLPPGVRSQRARAIVTQDSESELPRQEVRRLLITAAHGRKFHGRKPGAVLDETRYIVRLRKQHPTDTADDLYRLLRNIAQSPAYLGECPFKVDQRGMPPKLLKRGKPYLKASFRNALTDIDDRLARGEFSEVPKGDFTLSGPRQGTFSSLDKWAKGHRSDE